jgi:hypothetical protein
LGIACGSIWRPKHVGETEDAALEAIFGALELDLTILAIKTDEQFAALDSNSHFAIESELSEAAEVSSVSADNQF